MSEVGLIEDKVEYFIPLWKKYGKYLYEGVSLQFIVGNPEDSSCGSMYYLYIRKYREVFQTNEEWQSEIEYGKLLRVVSENADSAIWNLVSVEVILLCRRAISGEYANIIVKQVLSAIFGKDYLDNLKRRYLEEDM